MAFRVRGCAATAAACAAAAVGLYSHAHSSTNSTPTDRLARWESKWAAKDTRWHLPRAHPVLSKYLPLLLPAEEKATVLFPLCGASHDLGTLALLGHRVIGVEGVPLAVDRLLHAFGDAEPVSLRLPGQMLRSATADGPGGGRVALEVVEGDFLALSASKLRALGLPAADTVFDRGSIVAVAPHDRQAYAEVLSELVSPGGRILLVAVEHGPFSPTAGLGHPSK
mmetsp:Transcript_45727/g.106686  ORF Transcript_45727/g.106686 Transcript_45727/m.106686 type:complete len:224 (-) Transcript_45727:463-1134(-)